ncbi:RNA polymerase sigma factor [Pedobacter sandarakinus]|uniref:RNA polymerase sigma factor n=1 Tax=Pedobacter sandarakinus TaxID=353156 RepID=UPI00224508B4|nr:sigma-70 family RNA polymerase sigma factor [Pedobacter sandarakinus]MCX2575090.1 sigma-70 family RNA polymerase sigma factor [Pedobacter sandarakinus]
MKLINPDTSDESLWRAIKNGNEHAFKLVFDRYLPILMATARRYIKDEATCENLVQDIFLNIWIRKENLDIKDFKSYFTASARYQVYKELKAKTENSSLLYTDETLEFSQSHQANEAEERFHVAELKAKIDRYMLQLPKRCREIFLLSRREHLTNGEIASKLSISKRSVENQITAALKHLRSNIGNYMPINSATVISIILFLYGD